MDLNDIIVFTKVVETKSFTGAADALGQIRCELRQRQPRTADAGSRREDAARRKILERQATRW